MIKDFFNLLYPRQCLSCGCNLNANEHSICIHCFAHLPYTNYHLDKENAVCTLFWGRVDIEFASAFVFFTKKGKVQQLMHKLKYENKPEIGVLLGRIYGSILKENDIYSKVDMIIPVPLHPQKLKKRGYNQSCKIAEGLSEGLGIKLNTESVVREIFTETQTRKDRFSRWKNVKDVFKIVSPEALKNKHILLVDDVITTGATIAGLATVLQEVENIKISIVSLAIPVN